MRRPHFALGRIERDALRVGDIVAKLRFFSAMNLRGRNVESAYDEIRSPQLLDGSAIFLAPLFGLLGGITAFEIAI